MKKAVEDATKKMAEIFVKHEILTRMTDKEKEEISVTALNEYFLRKITEHLKDAKVDFFVKYDFFSSFINKIK